MLHGVESANTSVIVGGGVAVGHTPTPDDSCTMVVQDRTDVDHGDCDGPPPPGIFKVLTLRSLFVVTTLPRTRHTSQGQSFHGKVCIKHRRFQIVGEDTLGRRYGSPVW